MLGGWTARLAVAATLITGLPAAPVAHAEGVDQTCELTATRFDADTVNVLFPDSSAQYWSARYTAVPGTRIRIDGVFPYARYTSWNVYDPMLRPFAKKSDFELTPEPGSANPFLPGADRTTPPEQRRYTLFITFDPNDRPGPNTIQVDPAKNPRGVFTLRVYVPDAGRDITGGVGLPQVTWEPASSGGPPSADSPCRDLQKPTSTTVTDAYAATPGPDGGAPYPGRNPPVWRKFVNLCQSGDDLLFDNEAGDQATPDSGGESPCGQFGEGGYLSNIDNAYVYSFISRGFGPIVAFRGRAPTYAATYPSAPTMPAGVQLRYWSFCQNDPFTQRYIGCARDDQVRVDTRGDYTIVVSQPGDWPAEARKRCRGVTWLPWGPQPEGVMIYRHMLPAPDFAQAIQNVDHGTERTQMGAYYPAGRYFADWRDVARGFCMRATTPVS